MPVGSIIDSHVHFWDPQRIRYPWLSEVPLLNRPFLPEDYQTSVEECGVQGMIFIECDTAPSDAEREVQWITELAVIEPRIQAIIARAPLEKGRAVSEDLARLNRYPLVHGIRRILQSEADNDFCLRPEFVEGARALRDSDFSLDVCVDQRQLDAVVHFAEQVPDILLILDHIGKPDIRGDGLHPWAERLRALGRCRSVRKVKRTDARRRLR